MTNVEKASKTSSVQNNCLILRFCKCQDWTFTDYYGATFHIQKQFCLLSSHADIKKFNQASPSKGRYWHFSKPAKFVIFVNILAHVQLVK